MEDSEEKAIFVVRNKVYMTPEIKKELIENAARYETAAFLPADPSRFMHEVKGRGNQEIVALVAACLSYGSRKAFMPKIEWLLRCADGDLETWIRSGAYTRAIPETDESFYRMDRCRHVRHLLNGIRGLVETYGSVGAYVRTSATTAMEVMEMLTTYFRDKEVGHLIPRSTESSCKRLCMFLRWMVRDASPVDLGLWTFIDKKTLIIPLDTHVMQEARRLGLISSNVTNMRTAVLLTEQLREAFPDDPVKGDFALFGYGVADAEA